ncbi:hypothetical protein F018LOC_03129 [Pectobacterium versatile]|uniref:hypothetical protein n=1 Tax=Pectobacterium versatile TaxID=2488639 RepID=UPI000CDEE517|nr:hypothetical protein [Pectobacterium versatile]POY53464.1 hypothetical protein F018LOC_03129 [Pectobacterium versatile]
MTNKEQEEVILNETQNLFNLRSNYKNAKDEYLSELRRDCERSDGSFAQEARREANQNELREAERSAKSALDAQEKLVSMLTKEYLSR